MNLAGPPSLYIFQVLKEVWSFPVVDLSSEFPGKHWTMKKICHFTLWQIHLHQTCVSFLSRHQTTFLFINWCFFLTDCPPKAPSLVIASFGTGLQLNALVSYIGIIHWHKVWKDSKKRRLTCLCLNLWHPSQLCWDCRSEDYNYYN